MKSTEEENKVVKHTHTEIIKALKKIKGQLKVSNDRISMIEAIEIVTDKVIQNKQYYDRLRRTNR